MEALSSLPDTVFTTVGDDNIFETSAAAAAVASTNRPFEYSVPLMHMELSFPPRNVSRRLRSFFTGGAGHEHCVLHLSHAMPDRGRPMLMWTRSSGFVACTVA